ncbi:MAG TPA: DUF4157 domain-containing protein [Thermoanaerobaculia bacterium]
MNAQRCSVAPAIVHDVLRAPGQPLDRATRHHFGPRFARDFTRVAPSQVPQKLAIGQAGDAHEREADAFADNPGAPASADLSSIRVHTGTQAAQSARAVGARAYTVGNHIVFGAGEYAPQTSAGRRLLAHELAHAGQQNEGRVARTLQRSLTVVDPATAAPNQPAAAAGTAALTNAQLVQQWVTQLCGSGGWTVDPASGVLSSASRAAFCDASAGAQPGYTTSGTPTGCKCLCDATAPAAASNIQLHTGDIMVAPGATAGATDRTDVRTQGQGATLFASGARTGIHVGITGRQGTGVVGAAATSPRSGSGRSQVLQDPPWLILGHELCGHALGSAATFGNSHTQSPSGTASAVDIENGIRREHSTASSSLGIRTGDSDIESPTPTDPTRMVNARGAHYTVVAGDTLASVAARFGIATARITTTIFMGEGGRFSSATAPITDTALFIVGLGYHDVIAGETAATIATAWRIPEASLRRANPSLGTAQPTAGTRLFIPIS